MKSKYLIRLIIVFAVIASFGANKTVTDEKQRTNAPSAEKKAESSDKPSPRNVEIVGEWEMVGSVIDTNDNLQIDDAERKNLKPTISDYMKLNSDGSGTFTVAKMPGRYEVKDTGSSGKRYLTWYDKANGRHRVGTIVKVTKDELHIKEPGGHGLFVWKRL